MTALADSHVLITGGAGELGSGLAHQVLAAGAHVTLWDLDQDRLDAVADGLGGGDRVATDVVDVTDVDAVDAAAARAGRRRPVSVLVNNAGVVSAQPLLRSDPAALRRTLEVNTLSLLWVTRAVLPQLVEQRGHLVTIASAAGLVGVPRQTDYAASKHGAIGFHESLRQELRIEGAPVRSTLVCPYYIRGQLFDGVDADVPGVLPMQEMSAVTAAVRRAIERDRRRLYLPWTLHLVPLLALLPQGIADRILDLLGVTTSMERHHAAR